MIMTMMIGYREPKITIASTLTYLRIRLLTY